MGFPDQYFRQSFAFRLLVKQSGKWARATRILEQDKSRLLIELRPIWLMALCVGLFPLFFILGFGMRNVIPMFINLMDLPMANGLGAMPHVPGMNALGYASVIPLLIAVFLVKTRRLTSTTPPG